MLAAASRTMTNDAKTGIVFSSTRTELVLQGQLPDSLAGHGEDRVGQRGRGDGRARLADPAVYSGPTAELMQIQLKFGEIKKAIAEAEENWLATQAALE